MYLMYFVNVFKERYCVNKRKPLRFIRIWIKKSEPPCASYYGKISGLYDCYVAGRNAQTTGQIERHMKKTSFRAC